MPKPAISHKHLASEIARCLEDNEFQEFREQVEVAREVDFDLDTQYGKEVGYKTILHLAIDEDDHDTTDYIDVLLKGGASAKYMNSQLSMSPLHVAAEEGKLVAISLLLKYPNNKADVNALNKNGLTALHILLTQLLDLAILQNKGVETRPGKINDETLEDNIMDILEAIILIIKQKELDIHLDNSVSISNEKVLKSSSYKKLTTMTPLQILCSFQTWNARPITLALHQKLSECVDILLKKGADPNATAVHAVAGSMAGSTPPVLLAAIRGYHLVVEIFKTLFQTDFLVENKFQQNILHVVLKAGYYNKILVHGDESGSVNEKTIYSLFSENNNLVRHSMKAVINRVDSYGNSPLHYAKHYPDQEVAKFLLRNGGKVDRNPQGSVNVHPRTMEEFFFEDCMEASGEDADDEDFTINIKFNIFAQPDVKTDLPIHKVQEKAMAWSAEVENDLEKGEKKRKKKGKVDTKRLEHFADVDNFRHLLKHPVVSSFLEMELNNLKKGYIIDFTVYLLFVVVLYIFLGERFTKFKSEFNTSVMVYHIEEIDYKITISTLVILIITSILIIRELYQLFKLKKRYFHYYENMIEWMVLILVLFSLLPDQWFSTEKYIQKHLAAFTFLLAFMQLYLLLVRIVPNTPIPLYINMFTTVLRTYSFILLSYFAFLVSFAFSFSLVYAADYDEHEQAGSSNSTDAQDGEIDQFGNIGLALVKTIVMFAGEMDYTDIPIKHWLGYILWLLFVFLMVIVLMNLLNGLAVSDIHKIQKEVDTYYHISIVETLAYSKFVSLLADEILIRPNIKPESQKLVGIDIPGPRRYQVTADGKHNFYLNEGTVKAAKDLIVDRQAQTRDNGQKVTLEELGDDLDCVKKDQSSIKARLGTIEETVSLILDIMQSRNPPVQRI